ncbi:MAG: hypothetical protein ACR2IV_05335 [Bryobacteraceae bacterium]
MMKTCQYCKFEIPATAGVCGHCRKNQPKSSVPKTAEQIKAEKRGCIGCVALIGGILAISLIVSVVSSIRDGIETRSISSKIAREEKVEQQSSTETAKAILPGINRYAEIMEGKVKISGVARLKKEAEALRALSEIAYRQSDRGDALHDYSVGKSWNTAPVVGPGFPGFSIAGNSHSPLFEDEEK